MKHPDGSLVCDECCQQLKNYHMCDEIEGDWCDDCFPKINCEALHGEGCATHVFSD